MEKHADVRRAAARRAVRPAARRDHDGALPGRPASLNQRSQRLEPSAIPALPVIVGPTAGYLLSWPLAAALVGALAARGWDRRVASAVPAMLLGSLVIMACGFLWLGAATYLLTGALNVPTLLAASVWPFMPGDAIKVGLAALALPGGWALLRERGA